MTFITSSTNNCKYTFYSYFQQRVSIAIQRGNATSVLGTVAKSSGFEEVVCFKILLSCVMCKIFQILLNKIFLSTAASIRPYNHIGLQSFELCNVIYYHTGFIT
jgi:hypothetical protein